MFTINYTSLKHSTYWYVWQVWFCCHFSPTITLEFLLKDFRRRLPFALEIPNLKPEASRMSLMVFFLLYSIKFVEFRFSVAPLGTWYKSLLNHKWVFMCDTDRTDCKFYCRHKHSWRVATRIFHPFCHPITWTGLWI